VLLAGGIILTLHASRSTSPCSGADRRAAGGGEGCPHSIEARPWARAARATAQGPQIPGGPNILSGVYSFLAQALYSYVAQKAKTRVASVQLSPSTLPRSCVSFVLPVESHLPDSALGTSAASHLALAGLQHRRRGGRRGRVPKRPWRRAN